MRLARLIALTGYFGLILLILVWNIWLSPPKALALPLVLALALAPLLLALAGLLYGRPYTYAWISFLSLLYFTHGTVEAYSNPADRLPALLEVGFSVMLYVGAIMFARLRGRELKQQQEKTGES